MTAAPQLSFEFFPPKTPEMEVNLWHAVTRLAPLAPRFVSVTYGAGGSTRERTHATVARLRRETALEPAAHLTCVGASRAEIDDIARRYWQAGIRHIVALRGDPPPGQSYRADANGYAGAAALVTGLRRVADFEISVAAYPETHPEASSPEADLDNLKRKIDAGACRAITQFFFATERYFRFLDRVRAAGVAVPVVPGILPVGNFAQVKKFAALCGASIPARFASRFEGLADKPESRAALAIEVAVEQCDALRAGGVDAFHFYTLNRGDLVLAICDALGVHSAAFAGT